MKTQIRFDRLKKLANHLIKGKLGHEKFNFALYNTILNYSDNFDRKGCGTVGCAIGECPIVFPKDWCFSKYSEPKLRTINSSKQFIEQLSGLKYFGLTLVEYYHIFIPNNHSKKFGGRKLGKKATAKAVGNNILAFIKKINSN